MLSRRRRKQDGDVDGASTSGGREQWIAPQRLSQRVSFLVNRYAYHAPQWQLVVWLRQSVMAILSMIYNNVARPMAFGWIGLNELHYESFWLGGCLATMIAFFTFSWWHHWQHQPYAFEYQNRIESRFLLSTIVIVLLQVVWVTCLEAWRATVQNLIIFVLLISIANALFEMLVRRSKVDDSVYLKDALARIDAPFRQTLLDGDVRLVRCDWLSNADESGAVLKRMQELPPAAFFSPSEAAALFDRGDRSVLALSYRWHTREHPDPHGTTLASVRSYLAGQEGLDACGLFWE